MIFVELERQAYFDQGTWGELRVFGNGHDQFQTFECLTVECPWANNAPNVSCIPEGDYPLQPRFFHRGGYVTWEILDVPGRSHILVHKAVVPSHVRGCVGIGTHRIWWEEGWGIGGNTLALENFLQAMKEFAPEGERAMEIRISQRVVDCRGGWIR